MFSNDAKDILDAGTTSQQQQMPPPNRKQQTLPNTNLTNVDKKVIKRKQVKCPPGMHRELFNLYVHQGRDNNKEKIESLVPSNTKRGYTITKAQFGKRIVRKWHLQPFVNEARQDGLQLQHWEREDKLGQTYQFAQFNKQFEPIKFINAEYEECLIDSRWTVEETLHLLELCQRFDLRWPIIVDRFDGEQFESSSKKTMEDMKERYYGLVNELNALRGVQTEPLAYDAEHERRRKEQLLKLCNRTEEQIKEEEELKEAIKKIEAKRKDRERKAHDLQRLIDATERVSVSPDSSVSGTPSLIGSNRAHRRSLKKTGTSLQFVSPMMPPDPHIRWPEYKQPGPHLRSQEMKLPSNTAQRKLNNIGTVTTALKIVSIQMEYPHASEEIVRLYNDFRSNIVLLQDLKTAVHNTEQELDQLALRLRVEKEIEMPIDTCFRVGDLFYEEAERNPQALGIAASPQAEDGKGKGGAKGKSKIPKLAPVTDRRITKLIEVNLPTAATQTRKRRAPTGIEGFPPTRSASLSQRM